MRRTIPLVALLLSLLAPGIARAGAPIGECPNGTAAYFPGWGTTDKQLWWDRTVAGFEIEGIDVYEDGVTGNPGSGFTADFDLFADLAGFDGAAGLYDFVWVTQWDHIDKNGDGVICMHDRPHTRGNPAYFFNGIDNTAA
jgi:hypothetical protein